LKKFEKAKAEQALLGEDGAQGISRM